MVSDVPKHLDMNTYARIDHFNYFRGMPNPFMGVTVNVDVTELVGACRRMGCSFYIAFIHCAALAADRVPELRRRIHGDGIIEYERCPSSHIELLDNGLYCYCTLHHDMPVREYLKTAQALREEARSKGGIEEDSDVDSMYFMTSLPWLSYTALVQPTGNDSNPRISWGKYFEDSRGKLVLPVSILAHHALVDGLNLAQFYAALERELSNFCEEA